MNFHHRGTEIAQRYTERKTKETEGFVIPVLFHFLISSVNLCESSVPLW